tara:strand:- start:10783 stop:13932 length:3150 start_codon:yes stop_codon:yes gene_type:complete
MVRVPSVGLSPISRPQFQAPGVVAFQGTGESQQAARDAQRLGQVGNFLSAVGREAEDKVNNARAREFANTFENGVNKALFTYEQTKGKDGVTGLEAFNKEIEEIYQGSSGMLMNDTQRQAAAPIVDKIRNRASLRSQAHYAEAASQYEQQQIVAERIQLEEALRAEPLGNNSIALFLRLRQNLSNEAKNRGYSDERLDLHVLTGTDKLIADIFNGLANSEDPESAARWLSAVSIFEQSPVSAVRSEQSPQRGMTVEQAQAASPEERQLFGRTMLDSTRKQLESQGREIVGQAWTRTTVEDLLQKTDGDFYEALGQSRMLADANNWTETQRESVTNFIYKRAREDRLLRADAQGQALDDAQQEWIDNGGVVSKATRSKLREYRVENNFLNWVDQQERVSGGSGRSSGGSGRSSGAGSTSGSTIGGEAYFAANNNEHGFNRLARELRNRKRLTSKDPVTLDDLKPFYVELREKGISRADTNKLVEGVRQVLFPDSVEPPKEDNFDTGQISRYSQLYFDQQFVADVKRRGITLDENNDIDSDAVKMRKAEFDRQVDRMYQSMRTNPNNQNKTNHQVLDMAMVAVIDRRQITLKDSDDFGGVKVINGWFLSEAERQAAMTAAAGPEALLNSLEEAGGTKRRNPNGSYADETILQAAMRRVALSKRGSDLGRQEAQRMRSVLGNYIQSEISKEYPGLPVNDPKRPTPAVWINANQDKLNETMLRLGIPQDLATLIASKPGEVISEEELFTAVLQVVEEDEDRRYLASTDGVRQALRFINSTIENPDWRLEYAEEDKQNAQAAFSAQRQTLQTAFQRRQTDRNFSRPLLHRYLDSQRQAFINVSGIHPNQWNAAMQLHPAVRNDPVRLSYGDIPARDLSDQARELYSKNLSPEGVRVVSEEELQSLKVVLGEDNLVLSNRGAYFDSAQLPEPLLQEYERIRTERAEARPAQLREARIQQIMQPVKPRPGLMGQLIDWISDAPLEGRTREEAELIYNQRLKERQKRSPADRFGDGLEDFWEEVTRDPNAETKQRQKDELRKKEENIQRWLEQNKGR